MWFPFIFHSAIRHPQNWPRHDYIWKQIHAQHNFTMSDKVPPSRAEDVYTAPQKRGGVVDKLYPPGPQPGAKGRMKNHCRKFWWCGMCLSLPPQKNITTSPTILTHHRLPSTRHHYLDCHTADHLCCCTKKGTGRDQCFNLGSHLSTGHQPLSRQHPSQDRYCHQ